MCNSSEVHWGREQKGLKWAGSNTKIYYHLGILIPLKQKFSHLVSWIHQNCYWHLNKKQTSQQTSIAMSELWGMLQVIHSTVDQAGMIKTIRLCNSYATSYWFFPSFRDNDNRKIQTIRLIVIWEIIQLLRKYTKTIYFNRKKDRLGKIIGIVRKLMSGKLKSTATLLTSWLPI